MSGIMFCQNILKNIKNFKDNNIALFLLTTYNDQIEF